MEQPTMGTLTYGRRSIRASRVADAAGPRGVYMEWVDGIPRHGFIVAPDSAFVPDHRDTRVVL